MIKLRVRFRYGFCAKAHREGESSREWHFMWASIHGEPQWIRFAYERAA